MLEGVSIGTQSAEVETLLDNTSFMKEESDVSICFRTLLVFTELDCCSMI